MDKFLLGHDISAYVDNLDKINVLEKCLLISYLKSNKKVEKAKGIAQHMQLEIGAYHKKDQNSVNYDDKIFDLVLNLNSLNQNKDALGNLKKQAE